MPKLETKFARGHKVKIKGRSGVHTISYPMVIPTPRIVNSQFVLVDVNMYKFITDKETFYAYEEDCKT